MCVYIASCGSVMSSIVHSKIVVGAAVATVAITAASLVYLYKKKLNETPPTKWKHVGEIIDLNYFPIKSCGPIKGKSFKCSELGLQQGQIYDRSFMVVTLKGQFVTGRAHPKLVLIQPKIDGDILTLSAPEKSDIQINISDLRKKPVGKAYVWQQQVNAIDVGDNVAKWISTFVLGANDGFRLVFYPETYATRAVHTNNQKWKRLKKADAGALHDDASYMLINQGSMDELNTHLDHVVKPLQFRPNFVVKGPMAYEEDKWQWVRIGENVVFRNIKFCTRCIFTNINPETANRNPDRQPLKTLIENRSIVPNDSPVMGLYIGLRTSGTVAIGDPVYVDDFA